MRYVDGCLFVVPKDKLDEFRTMAEEARDVWLKFGAIDYKECVGDDLDPKMGDMETLPFPKLTGLAEDEALIFSFIVFSSRQHRGRSVTTLAMSSRMRKLPPGQPARIAEFVAKQQIIKELRHLAHRVER
jgi:uncharacterized protein YbaA (DUF1428 family)